MKLTSLAIVAALFVGALAPSLADSAADVQAAISGGKDALGAVEEAVTANPAAAAQIVIAAVEATAATEPELILSIIEAAMLGLEPAQRETFAEQMVAQYPYLEQGILQLLVSTRNGNADSELLPGTPPITDPSGQIFLSPTPTGPGASELAALEQLAEEEDEDDEPDGDDDDDDGGNPGGGPITR